MSRCELLAPAGSYDALVAAVRCGADAVYLGVGSFNARQNAKNFDGDGLQEAVAYCHARNCRVHLTLNTLVRDDEMDAALETAALAASVGVDALIVQDLGLARRIREAAPDLPLHASTQLSCHTPAGVDFLRKQGFSRVVLAREMSREEIAACAGRGAELEIFVHGALCMSVSGQCYLSAMLGGRSGNRGLCAQPCRLPWAAECRGKATDETALSLKDLSLLGHVDEFADLGIASLKIEGRMKRPEYVAAAVTVCRAALDGHTVSEEQKSDLQSVFSRSGFTDGYYSGRRGAEMFGHRRREDVMAAPPALSRLAGLYAKETPRVPVTLSLSVEAETPAILTADDGVHTVTVSGEMPALSDTGAITPERAAQQLGKSGGTPYAVTAECRIGAGLFLPASAVNALRREALERLTAVRSETPPIGFDFGKKPATFSAASRTAAPELWARVTDAAQKEAVGENARLFVPLEQPSLWQDAFGVDVPRGLFGQEETVRRLLREAAESGVKVAMCNNVGAIAPALEAGLQPVAGFGMNVMNAETAAVLRAEGVWAAMLSMELSFAQMRRIALPMAQGIFAYGRQPLMLMRNCPRRCAAGGCATCGGHGVMTDRTGARFVTRCSGTASELLNADVLYLADKRGDIPPMDFWWLSFTDETPERCAEVVAAYRDGAPAPARFTRGLYNKGSI